LARYAWRLHEPEPSARLLREAQKLRNDVAAAEAVAAFDAVGIASILLKGPAIERWLYSDGGERSYGDVDLLVAPGNFERAEGVLRELGFEHRNFGTTRIGQESHHEVWFRMADRICLELHRSVQGVGVSDQEFWDAVARDTERLRLGVGSAEAAVLAPHARALLVGLHAAQHGLFGTTATDLERALAQLPLSTWSEAAALAAQLEAEQHFVFGLSLVPRGREVAAELGLQARAPVNAILAAESAPRTAIGWEQLAETSGLVPRLRFLGRELVPTLDVMRNTDWLASRGLPGLAAAYLRRPFILARSAPSGFRAWRKARRRSAGAES
jgi:Uncharacterised nucleotidyltransferase